MSETGKLAVYGELALPHHATVQPRKTAIVESHSGGSVTFAELEERSSGCARLFAASGLRPGDHIAIFADNSPRLFDVVFAAERAGLRYTPISALLTPDDLAYIVGDCGARCLVVSHALAETAEAVIARTPGVELRLCFGGEVAGHTSLEEVEAGESPEPYEAERAGSLLLYSAGTTGRPKGVVRPEAPRGVWDEPPYLPLYTSLYGLDRDSVWLANGPLYHAGPLYGALAAIRVGATAVITSRFDPELALAAIERHSVTHSQWVPTMFSRLLKLPAEARARHDLSSHRCAVHGAAPCPIAVKQDMIAWWGPILVEFYGGTEGNGMTLIDSAEWLEHPGSVGKPVLGAVHVLDEEGAEQPPGEEGLVYFAGGFEFAYHNDRERTAAAHNADGWSTLGDIGYVSADGYLYLTDRASFMIISGGVNIYPREAEDVLILHPAVEDVAVIGVPNQEFGEEVKAVVQPSAGAQPSAALAAELVKFCRGKLAHYKCPRSVDFVAELPRLPSGKLQKGKIRSRYWTGRTSRIV